MISKLGYASIGSSRIINTVSHLIDGALSGDERLVVDGITGQGSLALNARGYRIPRIKGSA
ncbi:MAG: hypothetical protein H7Z74_05865 [Anaerolineae bacterium]|nr:hypothetical protein [Gemmatimonadaceae bacterium]